MTETDVIYNGACPICSREIAAYRRECQTKDVPIRFQDLQTADLARWGLDEDSAARRFHVVRDGQLVSGLPAFLALWAELPRYRWLARVLSLPVVRPLAAFAYDRIFAPALYALHRRRQARTLHNGRQGR